MPSAGLATAQRGDGLLFLPEIKYRRSLNRAFGPGGWALMPMGDILHFQVQTRTPPLRSLHTLVLPTQAAQQRALSCHADKTAFF